MQIHLIIYNNNCIIFDILYTVDAMRHTLLILIALLINNILTAKASDSLSQSKIYTTTAHEYIKKDSVSKAIEYYKMSLRSLAGFNSKEIELERAKVLEAIGSIYQNFDDYETAYIHFLEAEKLLLKNNYYNELIGIYSKMANIFLRNSDIQRNEQIIEKCNAIIDKVTDKNVIAGYYTNRGNVYGYNEDYEKCDEYFQKALSILNETGNQYRLGMLYYNIGYFAVQRDNIEKGEVYYRKSLTSFEMDGNKFDICDGLLALGRVLYYAKKYDEAESYLLNSLSMAQQIESKLLMRNTYITLSWLEHDRGNYKEAFEYSEKGAEIDLELVSENTQKQLAFLEVKHETEKKEQQILSLSKEKRLLTIIGITFGLLLLLLLLLLIARQRVNKHKIESL